LYRIFRTVAPETDFPQIDKKLQELKDILNGDDQTQQEEVPKANPDPFGGFVNAAKNMNGGSGVPSGTEAANMFNNFFGNKDLQNVLSETWTGLSTAPDMGSAMMKMSDIFRDERVIKVLTSVAPPPPGQSPGQPISQTQVENKATASPNIGIPSVSSGGITGSSIKEESLIDL